MNQVSILSNQKTMSSREIAEVVGSTHDSVLKTVRRLISKNAISCNEVKYKHQQNGQYYPEFIIKKRDAIIVISSHKPEVIYLVADKVSALDDIINALSDFEVPEECEGMYVYAIRNTTTGNVKLGISRNPEKRLKQLQTGNDCTLELVAYRKAENSFQDESALHHAHSAAHIRGEWFNESASNAIAQ